MKEVKPGVVKKVPKHPLEIEACRSYNYSTFIGQILIKCKLRAKTDMIPSLFKPSGVRIIDQPITIQGKEKEWTLGSYLRVLKKAPQNVKFGISAT